jgi:hypothetical protein
MKLVVLFQKKYENLGVWSLNLGMYTDTIQLHIFLNNLFLGVLGALASPKNSVACSLHVASFIRVSPTAISQNTQYFSQARHIAILLLDV